MSTPEEFFYSVQRAPNVDTGITPTEEGIAALVREGRGSPLWTFENVTNEPVVVAFGTSRFSQQHQCMMVGPVVRLRWLPGQSLAIPASHACVLHDVRVPVGSTVPTCMGGAAPCQLVRTSPQQEYEVHASLLPSPAAERAAVTRPKAWAKPDGES